mgnify:FL=1
MTTTTLRLSTCCGALPKTNRPDVCSHCRRHAEFMLYPKPEPE